MAITSIVVSVAGAAASLVTAKYAIYIARLLNAKLIGIYVVDEKALSDLLNSRVFVESEAQDYERELKEQGQHFLERIKKMAESKGVTFEPVLLKGTPHEQVLEKTESLNANLLVMGELKEVMSRTEIFYDEGERIFREAPCPVIVVKNPEEVERLYKEL